MKKKIMSGLLILVLLIVGITGCGSQQRSDEMGSSGDEEGQKTFVFGDTTFNAENGEPDINPHNDNSGWACISCLLYTSPSPRDRG